MTIVHDPDNGKIGDCFRCCIASLLDKKAEQVPHFCDYLWDDTDPDGGRFYRYLNEWLAPQGLAYIEITVSPDQLWDWKQFQEAGLTVYHVLSGHSERARHSVIARNGEMVHDPHPSRGGLIGPYKDGSEIGLYSYGFIIHRCGA